MEIKLRKYQEEAFNNVINLLNNNIYKQLIVLPTGSGKTVVLAALLKHFNKKALVIAHRKELIDQAKKVIKNYCKTEVGTFAASKEDLKHKFIVGSIQTCYRDTSIEKLKKQNIKLLIIDEAHHSSAKTYIKLIKELGFDKSSEKILLGFTATPTMGKANNLGTIFNEISYSKDISLLIKKKFLCPLRARKIKTGINLDKIKNRYGDYSLNELASRVNVNSRNELIVKKYKQHVKNGKTIAFCVNIEHAKKLASIFNNNNVNAKIIHGKLNDRERSDIISNFKKGTIEVLTSVGVLTEGFDCPEVNTILMTRPTRSNGLYIQMIGRGLRIAPNKKDCLILDFLDERHTLNQSISLNKIIPNVKAETDYISGDHTKLPIINRIIKIFIPLTEIYDQEFDILGKNNPIISNEDNNKDPLRVKNATNTISKLIKNKEWIGRAPFGYENVRTLKTKDIIPCEKNAPIVKFIFESYATTTISISMIRKLIIDKYNVKLSKSYINNLLKNPFYYGVMIIKSKEYPHKYKPLITKETFDMCQKYNKNKSKKKKTEFSIYRGLIKCKICGCSLSPDLKKNKYVYYSCTLGKIKHTRKYINEKSITKQISDYIKNIEISDEVINFIIDFFKNNFKTFEKETFERQKTYIHSLRNIKHKLFEIANTKLKLQLLKNIFKEILFDNEKLIFSEIKPFPKLIKIKSGENKPIIEFLKTLTIIDQLNN